jgi:hypothetical protein
LARHGVLGCGDGDIEGEMEGGKRKEEGEEWFRNSEIYREMVEGGRKVRV